MTIFREMYKHVSGDATWRSMRHGPSQPRAASRPRDGSTPRHCGALLRGVGSASTTGERTSRVATGGASDPGRQCFATSAPASQQQRAASSLRHTTTMRGADSASHAMGDAYGPRQWRFSLSNTRSTDTGRGLVTVQPMHPLKRRACAAGSGVGRVLRRKKAQCSRTKQQPGGSSETCSVAPAPRVQRTRSSPAMQDQEEIAAPAVIPAFMRKIRTTSPSDAYKTHQISSPWCAFRALFAKCIEPRAPRSWENIFQALGVILEQFQGLLGDRRAWEPGSRKVSMRLAESKNKFVFQQLCQDKNVARKLFIGRHKVYIAKTVGKWTAMHLPVSTYSGSLTAALKAKF
ncbi:hypothetical protein B0H11DRAFT_1907708 [Mycena galericulata]|nr:hypothetical protein B0H11DRAFT_1907708 [Mycena galericulata]